MLVLWKKSYDKPRKCIKKLRYHFADKGLYSQSDSFSCSHVYRCESWTIKKAERQRIDASETWCWRTDAFELWRWRRLLRVPWTARSSQSILKEISPEDSFEGLMLKLKHQYFGHLVWRANSWIHFDIWQN